MRRKLLPGVWLALGLALCARAGAEDLLEVYAQARAGDPVLAAAEAAGGIAREVVVQARAPLLPQASLDWSYRQQQSGGDARSREVAGRVSQVLLDLARLARLRSAQARQTGQQALLEATRQGLAVRVASAYFRVLGAMDALATVQANENAFARQVQQAEVRHANGLGAQLDVEQARTYHALARASTVSARKALHDARQSLAEITGTPPGELRPLGSALPQAMPAGLPSAAQAQGWVELALRDNPALRAEQLALSASEEDLQAARAAHLPTVSLALDSSRASQWAATGLGSKGSSRDTTLGLQLTLPLFAGGATESQRQQAAYQRDSAREMLEQRRRQLLRETLEQAEAVQSGLAQLDSTAAAVRAAERALAATQTGQELGTRSMTDLLLAIQNLGMARSAHSQARHQYVLARLLLLQAAGAVDELQLAGINALLQP